jgi:hypothetical protein
MIHIMTAEGWKPLYPYPEIPHEKIRIPFRGWEGEGAKSFQDWIAR